MYTRNQNTPRSLLTFQHTFEFTFLPAYRRSPRKAEPKCTETWLLKKRKKELNFNYRNTMQKNEAVLTKFAMSEQNRPRFFQNLVCLHFERQMSSLSKPEGYHIES